MAGGGPNPSAEIRSWVRQQLGDDARTSKSGAIVVPRRRRSLPGLKTGVRGWPAKCSRSLKRPRPIYRGEWAKMAPLVDGLRTMASDRPEMPVTIGDTGAELRIENVGDRTADVLRLAADLIRIPSVTNCPDERVDEVFSCAGFVANSPLAGRSRGPALRSRPLPGGAGVIPRGASRQR